MIAGTAIITAASGAYSAANARTASTATAGIIGRSSTYTAGALLLLQ